MKLSKQNPRGDSRGRDGLDKDWKVIQVCYADLWLEPQAAGLLPAFLIHLDVVFSIQAQKRLEGWWFLL